MCNGQLDHKLSFDCLRKVFLEWSVQVSSPAIETIFCKCHNLICHFWPHKNIHLAYLGACALSCFIATAFLVFTIQLVRGSVKTHFMPDSTCLRFLFRFTILVWAWKATHLRQVSKCRSFFCTVVFVRQFDMTYLPYQVIKVTFHIS